MLTVSKNPGTIQLQEAGAALDGALVTRFFIEEKRDFAMATSRPVRTHSETAVIASSWNGHVVNGTAGGRPRAGLRGS